ncbi:MAG: isoprenylcysteine carboxylmethyltransferase family protein [Bryobacteraceae bacterium]
MSSEIITYIDAAWIITGILWLISSFTAKPTTRRQSAGSRAIQAALLVLSFFLLFNERARAGSLAWRFVPVSNAASYMGLILTLAGICFAIWARFSLGRNWSSTVTVKEDHSLVRGGPYKIVRHPIYSGLLLASLGTALAVGEVRGLIAVTVALAGFRLKSLVEERFMREEFGTEYIRYQREVKALIPFLW